jgi:hypothetical protein
MRQALTPACLIFYFEVIFLGQLEETTAPDENV